jgi:hypothetical protein
MVQTVFLRLYFFYRIEPHHVHQKQIEIKEETLLFDITFKYENQANEKNRPTVMGPAQYL